MHEGKVSGDDWLPYFSSKAIGDVLMRVAQENPLVQLLVLCGHTHSVAKYQPLDNLLVEAGRATYECPEVQKVLVV